MEPKPPRPTDRLFFAAYPPEDVALEIQTLARALKAQHGLKGRPLAPERSHVTLAYLGDHVGFPEAVVEAAKTAADAVAGAPFEIRFDRAASFQSRARNRPFVLQGGDGVAAVLAFREQLRLALERCGLSLEPRFVPHVTLLYDDRAVAEQPLPPTGWTVSEFVLVRSRIGQDAHDRLQSWRLT